MKTISTLLFSIILIKTLSAQSPKIDSLNKLIAVAKTDTARINLLNKKNTALSNISLDSGIQLGKQIIAYSQKIHYLKGEANARKTLVSDYCFKGLYADAKSNITIAENIFKQLKDTSGLSGIYSNLGMFYGMQSMYDSSIICFKKSLAMAEVVNDQSSINTSYQNIAVSYQMQSDYTQALTYFQKALKPAEQTNDIGNQAYIYLNIGITFMEMNDTLRSQQALLKALQFSKQASMPNVELYAYSNLASIYMNKNKNDTAYIFCMKAATLAKENGDQGMEASSLSKAGAALSKQKKFSEAYTLISKAIPMAEASNQPLNIYQTNADMGALLSDQNKYAAAIPFYEKGFSALQKADLYDDQVGHSYFQLSLCYEKTGDYKKALAAYKTSAEITDSVTSKENVRKATEKNMNYEFDKKQQEVKAEQQKKDELAKTKQTALITGLILMLMLAVVAFTAFRNKRRANTLLQQQKEELQQQKEQIQTTLSDLKLTQAQLIQSEKMASLGELTAGIAHEIQNPLNFVNNFSEVTIELVDEMEKEFTEGNKYAAFTLSAEVKQNLDKIVHHGKRADAIVKGMLQHSRTGSDTKKPTDINALTDEYMRLSYHGLRAKDSSFNIAIETSFGAHIQKVNIISQDIGRVLLNLFNNAFYSVSEKKKTAGEDYVPAVSVITKQADNNVIITIKDNGTGVPKHVADKVFQPFFTTKPTGQGTGLGLSISYDIITKEHKGSIKVETTEGEGATFTICLPVI